MQYSPDKAEIKPPERTNQWRMVSVDHIDVYVPVERASGVSKTASSLEKSRAQMMGSSARATMGVTSRAR